MELVRGFLKSLRVFYGRYRRSEGWNPFSVRLRLGALMPVPGIKRGKRLLPCHEEVGNCSEKVFFRRSLA